MKNIHTEVYVTNESSKLFFDYFNWHKKSSLHCWFPEIRRNEGGSKISPLTPKEIIDNFDKIWEYYDRFLTTSEHFILLILHNIKNHRILSDNVRISLITSDGVKEMKIDKDGNFEDVWANGFFNERLQLI